MATPFPSFTLEYRKLREAADTFGFHREASLIARREESLGQPFTLFVVGPQGAGKSALINLMLGRAIAPVGRSLPWLNIYRRPDGQYEHAEVVLEDDPTVPTILSIQEAQGLIEEQGAGATIGGAAIDRIVWHVKAPGMPADVAFAEAPLGDSDIPDRYFWQADGLLWLIRADQLVEQRSHALVASMQKKKILPVMSMGVLTHMDAIPSAQWLQVVQDARTSYSAALDLVVPSTVAHDQVDSIFDDPNALFYRELRNRFFSNARAARARNQTYFVEAMAEALAGQFEAFVDRVLANRWAYLTFQQRLDDGLETLRLQVAERIQHYAAALKAFAMDRAGAMEQPTYAPPQLQETHEAPPSLADLGAAVETDIARTTGDLFATLTYDDRAGTQPAAGRSPGLRYRLPDVPAGHLGFLQGTQPDTRRAREASIYTPGSEGDGAAFPAELWQSAKVWIPQVADLAEKELGEWQEAVLQSVRRHLADGAAMTFKTLHGFLPGEAGAVLMSLEETYQTIQGATLRVPAPHLPGPDMSPALFLCRMQEPSFIERWNQELTRKCYDAVTPRLHKSVLNDLEGLRERVGEEWEGALESVHRRVDLVWKQYGRKLALKSAVKWSVPWVSALMRDRLTDPVERLARRRQPLHPPYDTPVALFLDREGTSFLSPIHHPVDRPLNPDQFIAETMQETIRKVGRQIWRIRAPITVAMGLRTLLRKRTSLAIGTLAGFALIWVMLFGTSTVSLTSLSLVATPYILVIGYAIKRLIDQAYDTGGEEQAERIFAIVQRQLHERFDALRDRLGAMLENDEFRETIDRELGDRAARADARYLSYGELVRRLKKIGEVEV